MTVRGTPLRKVGIVAGTEAGLMRDVLDALDRGGVDLILHAGGIGPARVLEQLEELAPVVAIAIQGDESLYHRLPWDLRLTLNERKLFLCQWLDASGRVHPVYQQIVDDWSPDVLVFGQRSPEPLETRKGLLYVNPGIAGRTPGVARSVATLDLATLDVRRLDLAPVAEGGRRSGANTHGA